MCFNPLNVELNPICHLLALLGAHHIFHVSRKMVKITKGIKYVHFLAAIFKLVDFDRVSCYCPLKIR
jgi:hypothetical protein